MPVASCSTRMWSCASVTETSICGPLRVRAEHALMVRRRQAAYRDRRQAMAGALEGLLALDLTSNLAGPYAAMMLADHGADVIKIEQPETGDAARNMPPFVNGESAPFMIWNRNKRSVTIDLKQQREQFLALVDTADFVVENYRPGVM